MQCRFIDTGPEDAFMNMAIDESILMNCRNPILRVYRWNPSAISIGYNQDIFKEIDVDHCKKNDIGIVRRITGGKAVYHDSELTYSFFLPKDSKLLPYEVNESYRSIANALIISLKKLGLEAEVKNVPEKIATPICFNSSNWYELLVKGKKISGSAQRRIDGKLLQHGSLLFDFDYEKNSLMFNPNNILDDINNLKKRITTLNHELQKKIAFKDLADAIESGFKDYFDFEMISDKLSNEEVRLANELKEGKYMSEEWNYRLAAKTI